MEHDSRRVMCSWARRLHSVRMPRLHFLDACSHRNNNNRDLISRKLARIRYRIVLSILIFITYHTNQDEHLM